MLVVTQRHQIEISLRRLAARQFVKTIFPKHLGDRAQPVGSLGVSRGRGVVETGGMSEKQRRHAWSWRVRRAFRGEANVRGCRRWGKGRAGAKDQGQAVETVIPGDANGSARSAAR